MSEGKYQHDRIINSSLTTCCSFSVNFHIVLIGFSSYWELASPHPAWSGYRKWYSLIFTKPLGYHSQHTGVVSNILGHCQNTFSFVEEQSKKGGSSKQFGHLKGCRGNMRRKQLGLSLSNLWIDNIFKGSSQKLLFLRGISVVPLPGK